MFTGGYLPARPLLFVRRQIEFELQTEIVEFGLAWLAVVTLGVAISTRDLSAFFDGIGRGLKPFHMFAWCHRLNPIDLT